MLSLGFRMICLRVCVRACVRLCVVVRARVGTCARVSTDYTIINRPFYSSVKCNRACE